MTNENWRNFPEVTLVTLKWSSVLLMILFVQRQSFPPSLQMKYFSH